MSDLERAQIKAHRDNLKRYRRTLTAKNLGELDRLYIKNRMAEENAELERLEPAKPYPRPTTIDREKRTGRS